MLALMVSIDTIAAQVICIAELQPLDAINVCLNVIGWSRVDTLTVLIATDGRD